MHVSSRSPCRPAHFGAWPHVCAWAVVIAPGSPSDSRANAAAAEAMIKARIEVSSFGCQARSARSNDVRLPSRLLIWRICARCTTPFLANFAYIAGVSREMPAASPLLPPDGHARATATLLFSCSCLSVAAKHALETQRAPEAVGCGRAKVTLHLMPYAACGGSSSRIQSIPAVQ